MQCLASVHSAKQLKLVSAERAGAHDVPGQDPSSIDKCACT